jgi:hypothetical protein
MYIFGYNAYEISAIVREVSEIEGKLDLRSFKTQFMAKLDEYEHMERSFFDTDILKRRQKKFNRLRASIAADLYNVELLSHVLHELQDDIHTRYSEINERSFPIHMINVICSTELEHASITQKIAFIERYARLFVSYQQIRTQFYQHTLDACEEYTKENKDSWSPFHGRQGLARALDFQQQLNRNHMNFIRILEFLYLRLNQHPDTPDGRLRDESLNTFILARLLQTSSLRNISLENRHRHRDWVLSWLRGVLRDLPFRLTAIPLE